MTFNDQKLSTKSSSTSENPASNSRAISTSTNTDQIDNDGYTNIWSQILKEVKHSTKNSPPPKSLILLGDNESGRSTLIARLKGVESVNKGIGLEYNYIDVKDEDRDEILKLNVWIPDGDGACTNLLKFALNETNFEHTMVAFVVSMSTPWNIIESLQKWANILREHVKKLNIPEAKRDEYMKRQYRAFQLYQDPDENTNLLNTSASGKKGSATAAPVQPEVDDDSVLLPLDPYILSKNIGLPIAVIVTKSDYISNLDKEFDYRIEHFDFIQFHVRRFCLEYGASLFYTTSVPKDKRSFENLYRYLTHKLYGFTFNSPASVVDREAIFIPSGWDNENKGNIIMENSATLKSDSDYAEIIPKPSIRKSLPGRELETILATDDQDFLARLQITLNKSSTPTTKSDEPLMATTTTTTPTRSNTVKPPVPKPANGTDNSTNLKNFFQNLLNKNAPSSTSASAVMTSPPHSAQPGATPDTPKLEKSPSGHMLSPPHQQPPNNNPSTPE